MSGLLGEKYIAASMTYGLIRKTIQVRRAKVYDCKCEKKVPMLATDKVMVVAFSTLVTPLFCPLYVYHDIKDLEIEIRHLNENDYQSQKEDVFDYLFF